MQKKTHCEKVQILHADYSGGGGGLVCTTTSPENTESLSQSFAQDHLKNKKSLTNWKQNTKWK